MTSKLLQMNLTYSPTEDRLLLRLSTTEKDDLQFWMTRRFVDILWKALIHRLGRDSSLTGDQMSEKVRDAVLGMDHAQALQESDFNTPFQSLADQSDEKQRRPAQPQNSGMPAAEGLLVVGGAVHPRAKMMTKLDLSCANGKTYGINLNKKLVHALMHLISQCAQNAGWALPLSVGDGAVVLPPEGKASLH